jgi:serine protease AprX
MRIVRRPASLLVLAVGAAVATGSIPTAASAADTSQVRQLDRSAVAGTGVSRVVVQVDAGADARARRAVEAWGGRVTRDLPVVDGFAAMVPVGVADRLASLPGVRAVSPDGVVRVSGGASASRTTSPYRKVVRADDAQGAGITGKGVTVALVDTGVAAVDDLSGRVVTVTDGTSGETSSCYNLSGEPGCGDSYGHGTFMAGLIAGDGSSSSGVHRGVAPDAKVLSVKVAARSGATDVSTVLAAIQWVVSHRATYGIDVLNLSLGTNSTQSASTDPLNYAVQRAWAAGIVVVVSAANGGPAPGTVAKPADDPWVVTAGATDDQGTPGLGDDRLPDFSSRGPTVDGFTKPDLAAPGAHVTSLRSPGSFIEQEFPSSAEGAYRRGSGTSAAAAIVSVPRRSCCRSGRA